MLPQGASTPNAGFACFGVYFLSLQIYKPTRRRCCNQLVQKRWMGVQLLRKKFRGYKNIDFQNHGHEVFLIKQL